MANKEVKVGDDWYLGENNDGDLIFYNVRKDEVVKAIDVITGTEDKKGNSINNLLSAEFTTPELAGDYSEAFAQTPTGLTIYVDTSAGSDSNDGSNGSPLATIQEAINRVQQLSLVHDVTIDITDGTYAEQVDIGPLTMTGGSLTLLGNTDTPSNVVIDGASTRTNCLNVENSILTINGLKLKNATAHNLDIQSSALTLKNFVTAGAGESGVYAKRVVVNLEGNTTFGLTGNHNTSEGLYIDGYSFLRNQAVGSVEAAYNDSNGIRCNASTLILFGSDTGGYSDISLHDNGRRGCLGSRQSFVYLRYCEVGGNSDEAFEGTDGVAGFFRDADEGGYGDNGAIPDVYAARKSLIFTAGLTDLDTGSDATSDIV